MDPQTEKEPAPHKKTPPGWLWWSLLGAGLYVLDQASKLWIIRRFPLNYLNEKLHKYAYLPDFPGFSHINADGTLDFATNGRMPEAELVAWRSWTNPYIAPPSILRRGVAWKPRPVLA